MNPLPCVAVAFSGGRDSTALLHATVHAASVLGLRVAALHVHHGLLPEADTWLTHAQRLCARWARQGLPVALQHRRLAGAPAAGDSVEAWARRERYTALADMAREAGATLVLLAHHRQDQAETVLLQALRGAGAAGLSAMPRQAHREGLTWARPWLDQPATAVAAYVRHHRLRHIEDGSNTDPRFARNRLRLQLWPALAAGFAHADAALALTAQRAQETQALLHEVAAQDLAALHARDGAPADGRGAGLPVAAWAAFSPARRVNLLRHWLAQQLPEGAPQALVQRLVDDLPHARAGRWPAGGGRECVLYRGRLRCQRAEAAPAEPAQPQVLDLSQPGVHAAPGWHGAFVVQAVGEGDAAGLPAALLQAAVLRPRSGGEQFQLQPRGLARALKKQYQARGVPEAERHGPLVWVKDQLVFVPGLGLDARAQALPAPRRRPLRVRLHWQAAPRRA
jgi:tRNA(Ile)-lysidine synthase